MKILITLFIILISLCSCTSTKNISMYEKAMRYDVIEPMCMEDAFMIGFATGYFGNEKWGEMLEALKEHCKEPGKCTTYPHTHITDPIIKIDK